MGNIVSNFRFDNGLRRSASGNACFASFAGIARCRAATENLKNECPTKNCPKKCNISESGVNQMMSTAGHRVAHLRRAGGLGACFLGVRNPKLPSDNPVRVKWNTINRVRTRIL